MSIRLRDQVSLHIWNYVINFEVTANLIINLEYKQDQKKTLVFCGIDGLFLFSTPAGIVKTCDRSVKIRKD
jgi:hypothetical protein